MKYVYEQEITSLKFELTVSTIAVREGDKTYSMLVLSRIDWFLVNPVFFCQAEYEELQNGIETVQDLIERLVGQIIICRVVTKFHLLYKISQKYRWQNFVTTLIICHPQKIQKLRHSLT
jgi:hypothetical protein